MAEELEKPEALVKMYLPYEKTVYDLGEERTGNAKQVARWRERQKERSDSKEWLWQRIIDLER